MQAAPSKFPVPGRPTEPLPPDWAQDTAPLRVQRRAGMLRAWVRGAFNSVERSDSSRAQSASFAVLRRFLALAAGASALALFLGHAPGPSWTMPPSARTPSLTSIAPSEALHVPILMYHHVGEWGPARPDWAPWVVRPADFTAQMDWLVAHGFRSVTFREVLDSARGGAPLTGRPVVITFDDGWQAQRALASEVLAPRGLRAVFFVYTGAIAPEPNASGYLSWSELRALEAAGNEVQSHTISHPRLTEISPEQRVRELTESRARIAAELKHPAEVLAYPYGAWDDAVECAAADAGYALAVRADADERATGHEVGHEAAANLGRQYRLPRVRVGYGDGLDEFVRQVMRAEAPGAPGALH